MSRIGAKPIPIPEKVEVSVQDSTVTVKGTNGEITKEFASEMEVRVDDGEVIVERPDDNKSYRALHGLTRSMIASMIEGVEKRFEKRLELSGVGYRVRNQGNNLLIEVGYSHPVEVEPKPGIELEAEDNTITVRGIDKQLVGEMAAEIRAIRKPEPYKGKGIRYVGEYIRRKEGKIG